MFKLIGDYKNLFVADFSTTNKKQVKIIFSNYPNFIVDGKVIYPFAEELKTGCSILISDSQHVKKLKYYVNRFGFPNRHIIEREKEKQKLVLDEVKQLKKLRRI